MKRVLLIISAVFISGQLYAQTTVKKPVLESLEFVPESMFFQPIQDFSIKNYPKISTPNTFLLASGWILQGLKYDSVIDEFAAFAPFDERAFTPYSFSELTSSITTNYLIIQNH